MRTYSKMLTAAAVVTLTVAASIELCLMDASGRQSKTTSVPLSTPIVSGDSQPTKAVLEIEASDQPPKSTDGRFTFRVVADDRLPETGRNAFLAVSTTPYVSLERSGPTTTLIADRKEWSYTAKLTGDDINLLKIRASICELKTCIGRLDKSRERIVDIGPSKFDDYIVVIHPNQLTAGRMEPNAFIDLQKDGHVITPTATIKLHAAARDGCVNFQSRGDSVPLEPSIDLVIDSNGKKSQTDYFGIKPVTLPPENCAIDVAVYDDEKQRPTPLPAQLLFKTNPWTAVLMSLLGCCASFLFVIWRRTRRGFLPVVSWSDLFEIAAKSFLAVLLGLVLTKTDFIGITIDKTSANGFFTTGFLLGFIPLDTLFDRILRELGVNPPDQPVPSGLEKSTS